jgi:Dyp-type peroxidase family
MTQAKGVLPKHDEDTRSLFGNPKMCGYFIGITLRPDLDRAGAEAWLRTATRLVDRLVARLPFKPGDPEGEKVAAVAVGLAPTFFTVNGAPRFAPPIVVPAGFESGTAEDPNPVVWDSPALAGVPHASADVLFYVVSVFEARVAEFVEGLNATAPDVITIEMDRGYQRLDGDEPFGYKDGVRNVLPRTARSEVAFVHLDREVEEPPEADDGTYLAFIRIEQLRPAFQALADDAARDAVMGRHRDGTRLDLPGVNPRQERAEPPPALAANAHVRKAGPRGQEDDVQIFRRGLPILEVHDGQVHVGLNFVSFQASLDQLDTILNDWIFAPNFPVDGAGPDRLLDPAGGLTAFQKIGLFFVPPHDERHLGATLFDAPRRPPKTGRLVVRKRVIDLADASRRFVRRGFVFRISDAAGQQVGHDFKTGSSGRAVFDGKLTIGETYTVTEVASPIPVTAPSPVTFRMNKPNQQIHIVNTIAQPNTGYHG